MIGAIIGAGLSVAGSLIGAAQQNRLEEQIREAREKATKRKLAAQQNTTAAMVQSQREQRAATQAFNPRLYGQNAALLQTAEKIRQHNAANRAKKKMGMMTTAAAQSETAAGADALGNATENAVAKALDYKQQLDREQKQSDANFKVAMAQQNQGTQNILAGDEAEEAKEIAARQTATSQATAGLISAAANIAGSLDSLGTGKSSKMTSKVEDPDVVGHETAGVYEGTTNTSGTDTPIGKTGTDTYNYNMAKQYNQM